MGNFSVWAPGKRRVRVRVDGADHEMRADDRGWWHADDTVTGTDYAYLLDDDATPLPDPRSRWQPNGVHEASRVYDHGSHTWGDTAWTGRSLPGSVLYELHIGTFTPAGTFDSAIERLDHLVDLGVDLVEVMPVNAVDSPRNWGYDGVLWYATHEAYGGPDGFKRFVDACHQRGLGVVLDVVHNHLGPSGAYLDRFGPYFAGRNIWGPTLNLDGELSDEVRRYLIDNALMWLRDFHVDALRLDAVHALVDTRATHVLEELAIEVRALAGHVRRPLTLIAESDLNDATLVTAREAGGYGLHAQWTDDVHHAWHTALTGERQGYYADFDGLDAYAATLRRVFFHAGTWSSFRRRNHGRPVDVGRVPADRFVVSLQNHDQVGNRAAGDRISQTLAPGTLACGAALMLTSPFTPMLFQGEEWGASTPFQFFSYFPGEELREGVRRGRTEEFATHGWGSDEVPDPNAESTYENSKLNWDEPGDDWHARLLDTYRALIALRRTEPALTDPWLERLHVDVDAAAGWIVVHRPHPTADGAGRGVVVAVNLADEPREVPVGSASELLLAWQDAAVDGGTLRLGARDFAVLRA